MTTSKKVLLRGGRVRILALALPLLAVFAFLGVGRASAATPPSFPSLLQSASSIQMPPAENISSTYDAYEFFGGYTSCGSAGFCASVGGYDSEAGSGMFVVPISDGVAAPAVQVALPANADGNGDGQLNDISCWGADSCVAVGSYAAGDDTEALAVPITDGQVGTAVEVALPSNAIADSTGSQYAGLTSVSCDPSGACVAVGSYVDDNSVANSPAGNNTEAMVVPITGGQVGTAVEVALPSNAAADSTGTQDAELASVSCEASGACVAVGSYLDGASTSGNKEALVVPVSSAGVPGASAMLTLPADADASSATSDPGAYLEDVSCPASGSCAAIGRYNGTNSDQPMVSSISAAGAAAPATEVLATLANAAGPTEVEANSVGCGAAGCDVVGAYHDTNDSQQPLVIPVSGSATGTALGGEVAVTLPGDAVQDGAGQDAWLSHISCSAAGSCLASGSYTGDYQGYSYSGGLSDVNLNALLVGVSGTSVGTGTSAPLPADASTDGRLSVGWSVGCGATGSCAVFAKYLQGFSTAIDMADAIECLSYGEGDCYFGDTEQPYVISAQAPLTIAPGSVTTTVTAGVTSVSLASAGSGGWGPYQWSVAAGNTLPAGLSLDPSTGVISGTPQAAGTYSLWVRADSPGAPAQNTAAMLTLKVSAATATAPAIVTSSTVRAPNLIVVRGNLLDRGGAVKVHLRCHIWGRCTGTVKLTWHGHVISKASHFSIAAGRTESVTVHLNAAGMKDAAGLRKPHHGYPVMNVTVVPKLKVGRGIPHGRLMRVI